MEMRSDFNIDEHDLDGELLRLPSLYEKWAKLAANAKKAQNALNLRRKILKAKLYKEAKERFEQLGKKPTAPDLEAEVRTNAEYESLSLQLIEAEEQTDLMEVGKWSIVEKSKDVAQLCEDRDRGFFMPSSSKVVEQTERAFEVKQQEHKDTDLALRRIMKKGG